MITSNRVRQWFDLRAFQEIREMQIDYWYVPDYGFFLN